MRGLSDSLCPFHLHGESDRPRVAGLRWRGLGTALVVVAVLLAVESAGAHSDTFVIDPFDKSQKVSLR
jgi:hypothetical protein